MFFLLLLRTARLQGFRTAKDQEFSMPALHPATGSHYRLFSLNRTIFRDDSFSSSLPMRRKRCSPDCRFINPWIWHFSITHRVRTPLELLVQIRTCCKAALPAQEQFSLALAHTNEGKGLLQSLPQQSASWTFELVASSLT